MNTQPKHAQLVADMQPLVHALATRIYFGLPVPTDLEDLIAYGQVGLAEAARDYRASEGNQFSTYAYYRIRGAIYDGLSKMSWTSRARWRKIRELASAAEADGPEEGGAGKLAKDFDAGIGPRRRSISSGGDSSGEDSFEVIDREVTPPQAYISRESQDRLKEQISRLPEMERRLIQDIYFEGLTIDKAAARLGLSKSWASRMHSRILEQLGRNLRSIGITQAD